MQTSWARLDIAASEPTSATDWLLRMLARNAHTTYLRQFGSPSTVVQFRNQVPLCRYEDLEPYICCLGDEDDVLFKGRPIAYERTGGSSSGPKLIAYSEEGLFDFQQSIAPWLAQTVAKYAIAGSAYFSISPATRPPEFIGNIPVGLPDGAYLGAAAANVLAERTAVPIAASTIGDVEKWLAFTIEHLSAARDLELISVWSPTFLLRLLERIPNARHLWPRLKVVSCWACGPSRAYAEEIRRRLPHADIEPKGLVSTEGVVTVPDACSRPVLVQHGFVEFAHGDAIFLEQELAPSLDYEVVLTTASGLYRYRTGDYVTYGGRNRRGRPILEFVGRNGLTCDLVGEKLTEVFVRACLEGLSGFAMLVPDFRRPGYTLVCEKIPHPGQLQLLEQRLNLNPQYAYARKLGQLASIKILDHPSAPVVYEQIMLERGTRLGDVKPVALRSEAFWLSLFEEKFQ